MTDTQWPRFEVFLIEEDGKPAEHVGSVHAPDEEMALLNARDVFVRRPQCRELWVAPSTRVLFCTAEELKNHRLEQDANGRTEQRYLIFCKPNHREPLVLAACLSAESQGSALALALRDKSGAECVLWAVIPELGLTRSDPEERAPFFEPAETKNYKLHADYPTARLMKEVRRK